MLEKAAASLYKALQAGRDQANAEVAATIARLREYQDYSSQFCKRLLEYLDIAFKHQVSLHPHTSFPPCQAGIWIWTGCDG